MGQLFNACDYLVDRRLAAGDGDRLAMVGASGDISYAGLHDRVCRTAAGLRSIGLRPEQRLMMVMADSPEFVTVYLAAMRIGAIPVPVSTMLRAEGVAELLRDSRARFLAITADFAQAAIKAASSSPELAGLITPTGLGTTPRPPGVPPAGLGETPLPVYSLSDLAACAPDESVYDTSADSPAFWLYTSGTTGSAK